MLKMLRDLSIRRKGEFLDLAAFMSLSDKNVIRDEKREETSSTTKTDKSPLSIQFGEAETKVMQELAWFMVNESDKQGIFMLSGNLDSSGGIPIGAMMSWAFAQNDKRNAWEVVLDRVMRQAEVEFLERIRKLPSHLMNAPAMRTEIVFDLLRPFLKHMGHTETPSVPKLMLYELMTLALADGSISDVERQILNEFKQHHGLEDYVFTDLLECAESADHDEKTITEIILE